MGVSACDKYHGLEVFLLGLNVESGVSLLVMYSNVKLEPLNLHHHGVIYSLISLDVYGWC